MIKQDRTYSVLNCEPLISIVGPGWGSAMLTVLSDETKAGGRGERREERSTQSCISRIRHESSRECDWCSWQPLRFRGSMSGMSGGGGAGGVSGVDLPSQLAAIQSAFREIQSRASSEQPDLWP